ncbi:MAG: class IV adenylate cyclase [Phycisphaerales bacterium]|nr:MAG: class IV adenylate cyclase [Phycisphaerales bacterium]
MSVEIEAKLKVASLAPVRDRLGQAGARFIRTAAERDLHYDSPDGRFRAADSVLRIRSLTVHRGTAAASTLTYKGPRLPGRFKCRPEVELEISDAGAAARLVEALGFILISTIEKRRETWELLGCRVELDEVPYLGTFVEIEGPDESRIADAQQTLDLADLPHVKEGYVTLLFGYCRKNNVPIDSITFARSS